MAATAVRVLFLVIYVCFVLLSSSVRLGHSQRPSFAGSTGGLWENYVGQRIPPGTPWPAGPTTSKVDVDNKLNTVPVDESTTTEETKTSADFTSPTTTWQSTTENYEDRQTHTPSLGSTAEEYDSKQNETDKSGNTNSITFPVDDEDNTIKPSIVLGYKPSRPSFAGSTGGTWESLVGQVVPSLSTNKSDPEPTKPSVVLEYKPNRPSFAGSTGASWESHVEQKVPNGTTTESQSSTEAFDEGIKGTSTESRPSFVLGSKPSRPSFAGSTGGTWESLVGQVVPSLSANKSDPEPTKPSVVLEYNPNRPSFAGSTGASWESHVEQKVPNGTTTESQSSTEAFDEGIKGTSTESRPSVVLGSKPSRPSFAGSTGGTWESLVGQVVPSVSANKSDPEPTKPSVVLEYKPNRPSSAGSTGASWESHVEQKVPNGTTESQSSTEAFDEGIKVTSTESRPSVVLGYKPSRPSFAGSTGGTWENLVGQIVPPSPVNESLTEPMKEPKLPLLYISFDLDDIRKAVHKTGTKNDTKVLVLDLNLGLKDKPEEAGDIIKVTEEFLEAEKCDRNTIPTSRDPVLSLLLNLEALTKVITETKMENRK